MNGACLVLLAALASLLAATASADSEGLQNLYRKIRS